MINFIIAGYDKDFKPHLCEIHQDGRIFELTPLNYAFIGSGAYLSNIYFDQKDFDCNLDEKQGLFFAFEAKKWAESTTGVGTKTDIIIIRKDPDKETLCLFDEEDKMLQLNKMFEIIKDNNQKQKLEILDTFKIE
jgi:20S proteasome alpha/beta subunit